MNVSWGPFSGLANCDPGAGDVGPRRKCRCMLDRNEPCKKNTWMNKAELAVLNLIFLQHYMGYIIMASCFRSSWVGFAAIHPCPHHIPSINIVEYGIHVEQSSLLCHFI